MTGMRNSLDRVLDRGHGEPMWKLIQRAIRERRIAVIDLGLVKNGDFAFGKWAEQEAERQVAIKRKEAGG